MRSLMLVLLRLMTSDAMTSVYHGVTSQSFYSETSQEVTHYEEMTSTRSMLGCVGECAKHSSCDSCVFDRDNKESFLRVQARDTVEGPSRVYRPMYNCSGSVPVDYATTRIEWRVLGQVGNIICNDDYMYSSDYTTIRCSLEGTWIKDGTCRQRIWRTPQGLGRFDFPRVLSTGWSMCVRGTACQSCGRFNFNLMDSTDQYVVHMDIRFDFQAIRRSIEELAFDSQVNDEWQGQTVLYDFPFAYGQPYELELRLLSLFDLQVTVNKTVITVYTAPASVTSATYLYLLYPTRGVLHFVDLWSGCD